MTFPLPNDLVALRVSERGMPEDVDHRLSPWGVQRNFEAIAQRFPIGPSDLHFGGLTTTLPSSPPDGTIVNYDTGTDGVVWQLRYDSGSASAYKWQFVGGPALRSNVQTDEGTTAVVSYANLATTGPQLTVPLVGEYDINFGVNAYAGAGAPITCIASPTATTDLDPALAAADPRSVLTYEAVNGGGTSVARHLAATITAAGRVVTLQYRTSSGTSQFRWRWMTIVPVRVG